MRIGATGPHDKGYTSKVYRAVAWGFRRVWGWWWQTFCGIFKSLAGAFGQLPEGSSGGK